MLDIYESYTKNCKILLFTAALKGSETKKEQIQVAKTIVNGGIDASVTSLLVMIGLLHNTFLKYLYLQIVRITANMPMPISTIVAPFSSRLSKLEETIDNAIKQFLFELHGCRKNTEQFCLFVFYHLKYFERFNRTVNNRIVRSLGYWIIRLLLVLYYYSYKFHCRLLSSVVYSYFLVCLFCLFASHTHYCWEERLCVDSAHPFKNPCSLQCLSQWYEAFH